MEIMRGWFVTCDGMNNPYNHGCKNRKHVGVNGGESISHICCPSYNFLEHRLLKP